MATIESSITINNCDLVKEVEKPTPQDDEVLIRIYATTVAAEDPGMRAAPGLNGLMKPKRSILGFYLAGEVVSTGKAVNYYLCRGRCHS